MSAILPLLGGLLLGRFAPVRAAIAGQVVLYAIAFAALVVSGPDHGVSHAEGAVLGLILAPLAALVVVIGAAWQRRTRLA